ncbi:MAG: NAD(P)-dependent oxidoreductase [Ponticaulis sp.]|nr:NAD(P)-dependent oxidoreductase [Ponticaulis sp.]
MNKQKRLLFCVGFGDTARALADRLSKDGWQVMATTRSEDNLPVLKEAGVQGILFDDGSDAPDIPEGAHWLISAPPEDEGCPGFRRFGSQVRNAAWVGYLSTTGVYGDLDGGWAFEWSPRNPQNKRSERRVLAEDQWRHAFPEANLIRLPGIYGPGRSALDRVRDGDTRRIVKDGQVFSRVMVSDIADCLAAAIDRDLKGEVLHPCDDEPAPPQDVITYAAELLGVDLPPVVAFEDAGLSPMVRSFYAECKRVSNARTKSLTGWRPDYPDYRAGLDGLIARSH